METLRSCRIASRADAAIFWRADGPIADCVGSAIDREREVDGGAGVRGVPPNRTGFAKHRAEPGSPQRPLQRFSWSAHDADPSAVVRFA